MAANNFKANSKPVENKTADMSSVQSATGSTVFLKHTKENIMDSVDSVSYTHLTLPTTPYV